MFASVSASVAVCMCVHVCACVCMCVFCWQTNTIGIAPVFNRRLCCIFAECIWCVLLPLRSRSDITCTVRINPHETLGVWCEGNFGTLACPPGTLATLRGHVVYTPRYVMKCGCETLRQPTRDERRQVSAEMIITRWTTGARLHRRSEDVLK